MATKKIVQTEKLIERQILEYLSYSGFFCFKNATVGVYDQKRQQYRMPKNKFQITGVSDIIAIKNGQTWFIEVKRPGNYQTANQKEFESNITAKGGRYVVVRSVEDLKNAFLEISSQSNQL